jgi:hypothetical protein
MFLGVSLGIISDSDGVRCIALILACIGAFLQWLEYSSSVQAHYIPGFASNGNSDNSSDHDNQEDGIDPL